MASKLKLPMLTSNSGSNEITHNISVYQLNWSSLAVSVEQSLDGAAGAWQAGFAVCPYPAPKAGAKLGDGNAPNSPPAPCTSEYHPRKWHAKLGA